MKDDLVFLVEAHFKPVLSYFSEIGYYKVDFHNVYVKLCQISIRISSRSILTVRIVVHRNNTWARNRQNYPARMDGTRWRPWR